MSGRYAQQLDGAARFGNRGESLERGASELLGQVLQLQLEAGIGLVAAVAVHRLVVGETGEGRLYVASGRLFHDVLHEALVQLVDVLLIHEAELDVELREVGLPVGARSEERRVGKEGRA